MTSPVDLNPDPASRHRNAGAVFDWLCATFGVERDHLRQRAGQAGAGVELAHGDGMVAAGEGRAAGLGALRIPVETEALHGRSPYILCEDVESLYRAARAAGATIVMDLREVEDGSRAFACRDPEGRIWSVGTSDPWRVGA